MPACLQRNDLQNVLYLLKVAFSKLCLKMNFKILFYKVLSQISKDCFENPIPILYYASKAFLLNS
jgi:hypothetical protein